MAGHRLLHLENNRADSELLAARLKNEGREDQITRVQSVEDFKKEIASGRFDALLCDYTLSGYDVLSAIQCAKKARIPTLIVSEAIGEESAVEMIKKGAFDYVSKEQLEKLSFSIDRAIEDNKKLKEYQDLQNFYETLVESSHALIFKMTPEGEILYQNNQLIDQAEFKGTYWLDLFENVEKERFQNLLEEASSSKASFRREGHLVSGAWVNAHFTPIVSEENEITSWVGLLIDITHLRKAEEQSKFKSFFLAQMSHELRTPLTTILGYCDFLYEEIQERLELDPSKKEWFICLEKIKISGEYLLGMLSNILNLSEIEAGKTSLNLTCISLHPFCTKLIGIWDTSIQLQHQTMEFTIEDTLPDSIVTDEIKLQQILMNLLSNAIKYTPQEKTIRFTVKKEGEGVVFEVGNEGKPFSVEEEKQLFEPFYRRKDSERVQVQGLGLGLPITKLLSESLGGGITVRCQEGWIYFKVFLPLKT